MTRPVSANALLHGVAEFWNSKAFTDLEVVCGVDGKVVQSHRLVLSALSPVIRHALARYTHFQVLSKNFPLLWFQSNVLKNII